MNKVITLGDIFRNLETEEKAFKFLRYVKDMQEEIERINNIINEFNEFIEEVYNHINLGDESDEFMLVFDKWQELKGSDKE